MLRCYALLAATLVIVSSVEVGDKCYEDKECAPIGAKCHNDNNAQFGRCKCLLISGHGYSVPGSKSSCFVGEYDQPCVRDQQCLHKLSCVIDFHNLNLRVKKCQCKSRQFFNDQLKSCRDAMEGDPCKNNACHSDLMECVATWVCECRHGSYRDSKDQLQCKLDTEVVVVGCQFTAECSTVVNGTRKEKFKCRDETCTCAGPKFVLKKTMDAITVEKCLKFPRRLGDECDETANVAGSDCSMIRNVEHAECVSNQCSCKSGFVRHDKHCVKASLKLKKELWALFWGKVTTYATGLYIDFIDEGKYLFEDLRNPYDFRAEFYHHLLNKMNFTAYRRTQTNEYECTFNGAQKEGLLTSDICNIALEPKKGRVNQVWQMTNTLTPDSYTGPESHHGYYLYFESTKIAKPELTAIFYLPTSSFKNTMGVNYCLLFDYNVYGLDTGDLSVHVVNNANQANVKGAPVWSSTNASSGKFFYHAQIDISVKKGQTVSFTAKKSEKGVKSDISVDRVLLRYGPCFKDPY